jgi:hypothetical protein
MSSVADEARRALAARVAALSAEERLQLTERLAAFDLELFCSARGVSPEVGTRMLVRRRQAGRRPSRVADSFLE